MNIDRDIQEQVEQYKWISSRGDVGERMGDRGGEEGEFTKMKDIRKSHTEIYYFVIQFKKCKLKTS